MKTESCQQKEQAQVVWVEKFGSQRQAGCECVECKANVSNEVDISTDIHSIQRKSIASTMCDVYVKYELICKRK